MKNVVIIGASGYLGNNVFHTLSNLNLYNTIGTCNTRVSSIYTKCNVLNQYDIDKIITLKPDVVIWTVMNQDNELELSKYGLSELVNQIDEFTRVIYLSTTIGHGRNQGEDVTPLIRANTMYLSNYVNGKILGESIVKKLQNYVIIRPGSIYGFDINGNFDKRMQILVDKAKENKVYFRHDNYYSSFINVDDLTHVIIDLIESDFVGVLNVASDMISYYEFNKHLLKIMNMEYDLLRAESLEESKYNTLDNTFMKTLFDTNVQKIIEKGN